MIPNIGPRGQEQRRRLGFVALGGAVAVVVVLVAIGAGPGWRGVTFFPLWISALGFFQAKDKT